MWTITKNILRLLLFLSIIGMIIIALVADHNNVLKNRLYNQKYIVVKIGSEDGVTNDKFQTPKQYKILLARSVRDTTMFIEWEVNAVKFYNSHIGDELNFKFINKNREFKIK